MKMIILPVAMLVLTLSCKTNSSSEGKLLGEGTGPEDSTLVIFESIPIAPSIMKSLGAKENDKILYLGKAQTSKKAIVNVLYSTDHYDLRLIEAAEVVDLSKMGETFSWTQLKRNGAETGKFLSSKNNLITEICSGESAKSCSLKFKDGQYEITLDGSERKIPVSKSFSMTKVKPSYEIKNSLTLKFEFSKNSLLLNVAENDSTEYSIGIKCKNNSYTIDYFSNQVPGISSTTLADLANKSQKSIWSSDGSNLLEENEQFDKEFFVNSSGNAISLEFRGNLMNKIRSECGESFKKNVFVVDGFLIRPS